MWFISFVEEITIAPIMNVSIAEMSKKVNRTQIEAKTIIPRIPSTASPLFTKKKEMKSKKMHKEFATNLPKLSKLRVRKNTFASALFLIMGLSAKPIRNKGIVMAIRFNASKEKVIRLLVSRVYN